MRSRVQYVVQYTGADPESFGGGGCNFELDLMLSKCKDV